ncbi:unnamed protein product [Gordionus sp. m RMFG-2023]
MNLKQFVISNVKKLDQQLNLDHFNEDVTLHMNCHEIILKLNDNNQIISQVSPSYISFSSTGVNDLKDYFAYIAKDPNDNIRKCYVLKAECSEKSNEIINVMGKIFIIQFDIVKTKKNANRLINRRKGKQQNLNINQNNLNIFVSGTNNVQDQIDLQFKQDTIRLLGNLIDVSPVEKNKNFMAQALNLNELNTLEFDRELNARSKTTFDPEIFEMPILNQPWYHSIATNRIVSEHLLKSPGDFLVRRSALCQWQFVLSCVGMKSSETMDIHHEESDKNTKQAQVRSSVVKHFLLVDPETGIVRSANKIFDGGIKELVDYHVSKGLPLLPFPCDSEKKGRHKNSQISCSVSSFRYFLIRPIPRPT